MKKEDIAATAHEVNRAYCEAMENLSHEAWETATEETKAGCLKGVELQLRNLEAGPELNHEIWVETKAVDGWSFGEEYDPEAKTHPCMVPFYELPKTLQTKDFIFMAVVKALAPFLSEGKEQPLALHPTPAMGLSSGMTDIKYVGAKAEHVDNLYGTNLKWCPGQSHQVPSKVAIAMLKHPDVYHGTVLPEQGQPAQGQKPGDKFEEGKFPVPLPHLDVMDKKELTAFAQQHFGEKLHHNMNEENMRAKIVALINERGR